MKELKLARLFLTLFALGLGLTPVVAAPHTPAQPPTRSSSSEVSQSSRRGRGVALLEVDYETGRVTSFKMLKSTGDRVLDAAAATAFSKHAFKPRTVRGRVRAPMTFTLTCRTEALPSIERLNHVSGTKGRPPQRVISEMTSTSSVHVPRRRRVATNAVSASAKAPIKVSRPGRPAPSRTTLVAR